MAAFALAAVLLAAPQDCGDPADGGDCASLGVEGAMMEGTPPEPPGGEARGGFRAEPPRPASSRIGPSRDPVCGDSSSGPAS